MPLFGGIELPGKPDLENVRKLDLLPIPMIRRMQRGGFAIDREYLWDFGSQLAADCRELQKDIASYIPLDRLEEFTAKSVEFEDENGSAQMNAASAEQIGKLLFDILGVGASRELKRTPDGKRVTTGKKQLELIKADHPVVQKILDYRERMKLKTSFCDTLPEIARFHPRSVGSSVCPVCERHHAADTWRVHTEIATTRAATGRLASRKPNLSQIPTRTELGAGIRLGFIASPGMRLISRDFAQIELRDLAHCANAASMIRVYDEDKDIHVYTACAAFQLDYDYYWRLMNADKKSLTAREAADLADFKQFKRMPSKSVNFGICYGLSAPGLIALLALSGIFWDETEANAFIDRWFNLYPEVRAYMELQHYRARRYGRVWDLFGRCRLVPEVKSFLQWIRSAGLRQCGNMPIQSCSAGQLKLVMGAGEEMLLEFENEGVDCWPLIAIHDQLMVEVEERRAEMVDRAMDYCFENVMNDVETGERMFRVPIKSDGEINTRWLKD